MLTRKYNPNNIVFTITGFPNEFTTEKRQAVANIFTNFVTKVSDFSYYLKTEFVNGKAITFPVFSSPVFTFKETEIKALTQFFDHWCTEYINGKEHSLNFNTERIGVDILFMEMNENHTSVIDAWLFQNLIPEIVNKFDRSLPAREVEGSDVFDIKTISFPTRNKAVLSFATSWLAAQREATAKAEKQPERSEFRHEYHSSVVANDDGSAGNTGNTGSDSGDSGDDVKNN